MLVAKLITNSIANDHLIVWGYSSAGRALAWHARGHRFDPDYLHQSSIQVIQGFRASVLPVFSRLKTKMLLRRFLQ